jgi:hypothetical protein
MHPIKGMRTNKMAPLIGIELRETTMFLNIVEFFVFNFSEIQMESSLVLWMNGEIQMISTSY